MLGVTCLCLLAAGLACPLEAATITVNSTTLTPTQGDGKCTLIEALENARSANGGYADCAAGSAASNIIELQSNQTYTLPTPWTNGGTAAALGLPVISRPLTINGHGSTFTRAANAGSFRVLYVVNSTLTVNDLTLRDFILPNTADGVIYNDNGVLTINRVTVRGTRADASASAGGGAVTSRACSPVILAACSANKQATLTVADSAFDDNESRSANDAFGAGAGVNTFAIGSGAVNTATIVRSRFHANTATNQGGAISNAAYDGSATSTTSIDRSSITGNMTTGQSITQAFGGGLANFVGKVYTGAAANTVASLTITNSSIVSNTAANSASGDGYGGGIFSELNCGFQVSCGGGSAVHLTLNSVTLYGNTSGRDHDANAFGRGAAVWSNNNDPTGTGDFTIRDSLIGGNSANGAIANCRIINSAVTQLGYDIASDGTCGGSSHVFSEGQINLGPLTFSSFTYYRPPLSGSAAIDKAICSISVDQLGTARPIGSACDVGAIESNASAPPTRRTNSDFNGDGRTDAGYVRPSLAPNVLWYSTPTGGGAPFQIYFGAAGDIPVPADYDGDGKADAVVFRPSSGLWVGPRTGGTTLVIQLLLGQNGDIPVPCDYDGDGAVDPAIYRPSTGFWFGTRANSGTVVLNTTLGGHVGDIPVPADYDGDGRCDAAFMRPGGGAGGTNLWFAQLSGGGTFQVSFGAPGDIPVPADYDGDGKADAVTFRPSNALWYGLRTGTSQIVTQTFLGSPGDIPIPGDYDGDGKADLAIYHPSTGGFFGTNAAGTIVVLNTNIGVASGDIPTAQRPRYPGGSSFAVTSAQASAVVRSNGVASTASDAATPRKAGSHHGSAPTVAHTAIASNHERARPFTVAASDPKGTPDIAAMYLLVTSALNTSASCVLVYHPAANALQLADDNGATWSPLLALGHDGKATNADCAIDAGASFVSVIDNALEVSVAVTFHAPFGVPRTVYGLAIDQSGASTGWQTLGDWTVHDAGLRSMSLVSPLSGRGMARTFTFQASMSHGAVGGMYVLVNSSLSPASGCLLAYDPATRQLRLADNNGTNWSSPLTVGGSGTIANSQCTIQATGLAVSASENNLMISVPVILDAGFGGTKAIYGQVVDAAGRVSSWQSLGSWTVPGSAPGIVLKWRP
jgi:hypothetical protein